jgi:hypothetical protein
MDMRIATLALFLCLASSAHADLKERPTDADLALSSLESYAGTGLQGEVIQSAKERIEARAAQAPDEDTSAALIFNKGLTPSDIEQLTTTNGLEVAYAELKAVAGSDGRVYTMFVGARDLLVLPGTVGERLRSAVGQQRAEFLQLSKAVPGDEGDTYRELAYNRSILCYRIDAIGKIRSVNAISNDPRVAATFLQERTGDSDPVAAYRAVQRDFEARRGSSPIIIKGPPPSEDSPMHGYRLVPPAESPSQR